ncbi:hypothetical protein RRG08_052402 [Elysia crispata]|uniref:Uncharacterized protein n=1 Tax=Elysia crispata TaxID=231223 RepID=A0AAE1B3B7_9GAST|nr:hypothetical protein RRG08_052402 [Elysia crispata]
MHCGIIIFDKSFAPSTSTSTTLYSFDAFGHIGECIVVYLRQELRAFYVYVNRSLRSFAPSTSTSTTLYSFDAFGHIGECIVVYLRQELRAFYVYVNRSLRV